MRRGFHPRAYFENGQLVAVATGSDACAEHECGSRPLMRELCEQYTDETEVLKRLISGKRVEYPQMLEIKRIVKFPASLQFSIVENEETPEAVLSVYNGNVSSYFNTELAFPSPRSQDDQNIAGAWDERSFAVRVRGKGYVEALNGFYQDLRKKKVVFGGMFFHREPTIFSGVILVNSRYLSEADLANIEKAQHKYESALRLKARDDSTLVSHEVNEALKGRFGFGGAGFIWAKWKDEHESEVVYGFNPWNHKQAAYGGPYTREELLAWADAQASYKLVPKAALA